MPLIENHPHLWLSGPPGGQSGQGMGRVILWAKYSIDCHSGANGQRLGGDYMVIRAAPIRNPFGIRGEICCVLWKKYGV
jgi:hypothetical protein